MKGFVSASIALLLLSGVAHAQSPLGIEVRGGASFPVQDLTEGTKLETGGGFGFTVTGWFLPHTAAYVGWTWNQLGMNGPSEFEDNGYAFGLQFQHPLAGRFGAWARAGGIYNHVEVEDDDGNDLLTSDHTLGFEVGGGVAIGVGRFTLLPGVRYRSFSPDIESEAGTFKADVSYLTLDLGIQFRPGSRPMLTARR